LYSTTFGFYMYLVTC